MSVKVNNSRGGFWGLVEQKGPWKTTTNDIARSYQPYTSKEVGGGIQVGGTKNAGHAGWYAQINPNVDANYGPPPPKPSQYVQKSIISRPLPMMKGARGSVLYNSPVESIRAEPDSSQKPGSRQQPLFQESEVETPQEEAPRVEEVPSLMQESDNLTEASSDYFQSWLDGQPDDESILTRATNALSANQSQDQSTQTEQQRGSMGTQTPVTPVQQSGFQTDKIPVTPVQQTGFQTDKTPVQETGFQTDKTPVQQTGFQTDPIINDVEMEQSTGKNDNSTQTDPWIEDTVMTIESELVQNGYLPDSDLFQLVDSFSNMKTPTAKVSLKEFIRGKLPSVPKTSTYDFEQAKREFEEFTTRKRGNRPSAAEPRSDPNSKKPMFDFVNRPEIKTPSSSKTPKRQTTGMSSAQLFYEAKRKLDTLTKFKEKLIAKNKTVPRTIKEQIYQAEQDIKKHETKIRNMEKRKGKQKS